MKQKRLFHNTRIYILSHLTNKYQTVEKKAVLHFRFKKSKVGESTLELINS